MKDPVAHPEPPFAPVEQRFFDLSIDMMCVLGFDGYFRLLNAAWETTLGFTREELMARPFIDFVHPDDHDRTQGKNTEVRSGGQTHLFENRYRCKDGTYRWLLWNSRPDPARQVIYGVARDVTAQKAAADERERLLQQLQTAAAELKTLREFLPICSYCKSIRDDEDYWHSLETYISTHTNTQFSHGVCPSCFDRVMKNQFPG